MMRVRIEIDTWRCVVAGTYEVEIPGTFFSAALAPKTIEAKGGEDLELELQLNTHTRECRFEFQGCEDADVEDYEILIERRDGRRAWISDSRRALRRVLPVGVYDVAYNVPGFASGSVELRVGAGEGDTQRVVLSLSRE